MKFETTLVGYKTRFPLSGCLTLPDELDTPVPAVVFVHGAGPATMDGAIGNIKMFRDLSEELAEEGIASLRYDKRTHTYGMNAKQAPKSIYEETIEDAVRAIKLLQLDERIDKNRIFLVAHSLGATAAHRIDEAADHACAGFVLLALSPLPLHEVVLMQLEKSMENANFLAKRVINKQYKKFKNQFSQIDEVSDEEAKKIKCLGDIRLYYFKDLARIKPLDHLKADDRPTLILQGGKDFQTTPDHFSIIEDALEEKENVECKVYPDLNHAFVEARYDDIAMAHQEYTEERPVDDEVCEDIIDFIHEYSHEETETSSNSSDEPDAASNETASTDDTTA